MSGKLKILVFSMIVLFSIGTVSGGCGCGGDPAGDTGETTSGDSSSTGSTYKASHPDLVIKNINYSTGDGAVVMAVIKNTGVSDAENVLVDLWVDGSFVCSSTIARIISNSEEVVTLDWNPETGKHFIQLRVDPYDTIFEEYEDNNVVNLIASVSGEVMAVNEEQKSEDVETGSDMNDTNISDVDVAESAEEQNNSVENITENATENKTENASEGYESDMGDAVETDTGEDESEITSGVENQAANDDHKQDEQKPLFGLSLTTIAALLIVFALIIGLLFFRKK